MENEIMKNKIFEKFNQRFDEAFFEKIEVVDGVIDFYGFRGEEGEELEADEWARKFAEEFNLGYSVNY